MEVQVQIFKADGKTLPEKTKFVAPRNNILHTLFDKLTMYINEVPITKSDQHYAYKAYVVNCLTYGSQEKLSHLETQGWYKDTAGYFNDCTETKNTGFFSRCTRFRTEYKKDGEYRPNGAKFIGRIYHDLVNCETGLIPNTRVKFVFTKNADAFILQTTSDDTEQYVCKIANIALYVPVAQLALPIYNELNLMMAKNRHIAIHYRRIEIRPYTIPVNSVEYWSPSLFSESDLPCRIIGMLIVSNARIGDYHSNPYYFRRSWPISGSGDTQNTSEFNLPEQIQQQVQHEVQQQMKGIIEEQFAEFFKKFATSTKVTGTKQKDKSPPRNLRKPRNRVESDQEESNSGGSGYESDVRREAQKRLMEFINQREEVTNLRDCEAPGTSRDRYKGRTQSSSLRSSSPPQNAPSDGEISDEEDVHDGESNLYIKKIELLLNQTPIDQLSDEATGDECINTFFRMFSTNGQINSLFTNSISYDEFRKGYFFMCYDLSTSSKCGTNYLVPSIRVGHLRFR